MRSLLLIVLLLINLSWTDCAAVAGNSDSSTYSNYEEVQSQHFHLDWKIYFEESKVEGTITFMMKCLKDTNEVRLDFWNLRLDTKNYRYPCLKYDDNKGYRPVRCYPKIQLENSGDMLYLETGKIFKGEQFNITVHYLIGNDSMSLSFLTKEQTSTKLQPYIFTQNEPIYARSLAPLQDTPMIKQTWTADVFVPKNIQNVFMSAKSMGGKMYYDSTWNRFSFSMFNPVPSYLLAIIAGNVEEVQIDERTKVIAEPDKLEEAKKQLEDLGTYLKTIEDYIGVPYAWQEYKIVIMPPSFPIGGMENPLLTFASPSIISSNGQKSGVTVAVHEIAHSWTGNMVTCANWSSMWLNEGFTVFLERQADQTLYGLEFYKTDSINGNDSMYEDIESFGPQSNFSSIFPQVAGRNPDDAFSELPYEKGFQFLTYIEEILGAGKMRDMLNKWVRNMTWKSAGQQDFKDHLEKYIYDNWIVQTEREDKITQINWDVWVKGAGLPPNQTFLINKFSTPLIAQANTLADQFIQENGTKKPDNWAAGKTWQDNVKFIFLQRIYSQSDKLNENILSLIDDSYNYTNDGNAEIRWRWYRIVPFSKTYQDKIWDSHIFKFLGSIGRGKMIDPIYQSLMDTNQQTLAANTFDNYRSFYHPIQRGVLDRIIYQKQKYT